MAWVLAALAVLGAVFGPGAVAGDDRSTELLRYQCSSALGRRDVTLFANGTVRLRQGLWEEQEMYLDELLREELSSYVAQLREIQASRSPAATDLAARLPDGEWVEHCEIRLELPDAMPVSYEFSGLEVPPLVVASLIHVAEDLAAFTRPLVADERVPSDYQPRIGDVFRTVEGERFRILDFIETPSSVELEGLDTPMRLYMTAGELATAFAVLEPRDGG
ncbi:MAG: hypothetical protein GY719_33140 [bacterium]|nr:hypothetical protein [bacterium]